MSKCNFDWSICQTCANAGSNLCPLENNRTVRNLKNQVEELEERIEESKSRIEDLEDRIENR